MAAAKLILFILFYFCCFFKSVKRIQKGSMSLLGQYNITLLCNKHNFFKNKFRGKFSTLRLLDLIVSYFSASQKTNVCILLIKMYNANEDFISSNIIFLNKIN